MASFTWTNAAGGDWSDPSNWSLPLDISPPRAPRTGDSASFNDLANSYTVTVQARETIGDGTAGPSILINATSILDDVAFSISGTLTADFLYQTATNGPATNLTIKAGGSLIVPDLIFSSNVSETVTIAGTGPGGYLELGGLTVGGFAGGKNPNMVLDFANAGPTSLNTGVIQIDNVDLSSPPTATQVITDVALGDKIVINGADFAGDTVSLDTTANDLKVVNGGSVVFTMNNISLEAGTSNDFAIVNGDTIEAVCYVRGTRILTPAGERPVETLRTGMQIMTLVDGQEVPQTVTWLGHRRVDLVRHPRPEAVAPIRIERDAFADNVPHTDLVLSPDHAVFVDGLLICIRQLVNGSTIRRERDWTEVDYYHVELNQHAILLAEGLPAESYIDTGNRSFFANSSAALTLYPDLTEEAAHATREAGSCAPFVWDEPSVQPVWQRLADRASEIGRPVPRPATTTEAGLRLVADRRPVEPVFSDSDRVIFVLPRGASEVRLLSRAQSATGARPWLEDRRRLGARVARIVLRGADETREIPVDHPGLARGWWAVEREGQRMCRWTDGEAVLPLPAMHGHVVLEFHLSGSMIYAVDAVPAEGTKQRVAA